MRSPLIAMLLSALAAFPVFAADGTYRCKANGDIPIGVLTLSGSNYEFAVTRTTDFAPAQDPANGGGELEIGGGVLRPLSGPLLTKYAVVGGMEGDVVFWNNRSGTLMACWPQ
jgi:hypothetical protein